MGYIIDLLWCPNDHGPFLTTRCASLRCQKKLIRWLNYKSRIRQSLLNLLVTHYAATHRYSGWNLPRWMAFGKSNIWCNKCFVQNRRIKERADDSTSAFWLVGVAKGWIQHNCQRWFQAMRWVRRLWPCLCNSMPDRKIDNRHQANSLISNIGRGSRRGHRECAGYCKKCSEMSSQIYRFPCGRDKGEPY